MCKLKAEQESQAERAVRQLIVCQQFNFYNFFWLSSIVYFSGSRESCARGRAS